MKIKKFLGLAIASTLALSMSAPAFALPEEGSGPEITPQPQEPGKFSFDYNGETWTEEDVIINVSMPTVTSTNIILNPYKLAYLKPDETPGHDAVVTGDYNYVENLSNFPVAVSWEVTGTAGGKTNLLAKAPTSATTAGATNDVYLPIVITATEDKDGATVDAGTTNITPMNVDATNKLTVTNGTVKSIEMAQKKADYASTTKYCKPVLLDAANWSHSWNSVSGTLVEAKKFLAFGIAPFGVKAGTDNDPNADKSWINNTEKLSADSKWASEDTVSVKMVFTFAKAPSWVEQGDQT